MPRGTSGSSRNLSNLAQPVYKSGLTGSQSLSSLSALAAEASSSSSGGSRLPASANPRSAVNRRAAARPLYLGAGYSSSAVARRKRAAAQAQMSSLYGSLDTFGTVAASEQQQQQQQQQSLGTPGKRRRIGEDVDPPFRLTNGSPVSTTSRSAFPPFSQPSSTIPSPSPVGQSQSGLPAQSVPPLLFNSSPYLKAKFGLASLARPSPLRQDSGK